MDIASAAHQAACDTTVHPQSSTTAARLTTCASGFFRTAAFQATIIIATELRAKLQERLGLSLGHRQLGMSQTLDEAKSWSLQCIKSGETNVKSYLLICLIAAHVEALCRRERESTVPILLAKAAKDALDVCLPILEEAAGQLQSQRHADSLPDVPSVLPVDTEDWDSMVSCYTGDTWISN